MYVNELFSLKNKTAIVTGGTGWLGSSISAVLSELGANVFVVSRGNSKNYISNAINLNNYLNFDLSKINDIEELVKTVISITGKIDILVNNSYTWPKTLDFTKSSIHEMSETMVNCFVAPVQLTKLVYQTMIERNIKGSIINVASMYGSVAPDHKIYRDSGRGNALEYGASKAAIIQATKYIASIGGKHGIRCNSVSPGPFPKPETFVNAEWFQDELNAKTMLNRVGNPDELKGVFALLASDASSYITGADIPVDGGWTSM